MFSLRGARLFVFPGGNDEKRFNIEVNSNRVTIGGHPLNYIRLHTGNPDRLHCEIFADSANSVTIKNYSLGNPIHVNGVSVESTAKLHNNDRFEVAGSAFLWSFDPVQIKMVSKPTKRPYLHSRRKTITLKRIRSTGDITKHSFIKVPRAVGLVLDEFRKRRTIHSTMSEQLVPNDVNRQDRKEVVTNAPVDLTTEAALNITISSDLASCITPIIEKENIIPGRIKAQNASDTILTPPISAAKRRHLACHTPVSNLIDLTTPPAKSRPTTVMRKAFSSQRKAVQSPRLPDVVNIVTPSPKRISRTPTSLRAAVSTPKTTLLKSAIKNSRAQDQLDAKNTSIRSISTKKTPNVKLNTSRTNTPKLTPASTKSSSVKIRKHLISTLSENKEDGLLKTDSPVPIINTGRFSKHSTPTIGKGTNRTPKGKSLCVIPKFQLPEQCSIHEYDNDEINVNMKNNAEEVCASVVPIIDVESIIKKPNQTTQIRSAKYSDITPHESFADGLMPVATSSEENVLTLQTESIPLPSSIVLDELKSMNDIPTNFNPNRNSCSSLVAAVSTESSKIRKTMSEFSSNLSGSPLRRFSQQLIKLNIQIEGDINISEFEPGIDALNKEANEHEILASYDSELPVRNDKVSTLELRHSWRHTRKCIGSAFTSLNTSRPQLDLTAEIDESLVFIEDDEIEAEQNELHNMECSKALSTTNEPIVLHQPSVNTSGIVQMQNVTVIESTSDLLAESSLPGEHEGTLERMENALDAAKESAVESASDLIAESSLSAEHEETLVRMEDVPDADKESAVESTSDLIAESSLPGEHEGTLERMEDAPDADKETTVESTPDLISESSPSGEHEKALERMEDAPEAVKESVVESISALIAESFLPGEHEGTLERMENALDADKESAVESASDLIAESSLSAEHEETLERMEDAPEADKETVVESTSDLIAESSLSEEHEETLERMEDAPDAHKETTVESTPDLISESSLSGEHEKALERMEDAPEAVKESVVESISALIAESFLPGEHEGTLERMENALDADKESAVESASDLIAESSLSAEHEETLERMEDAPEADKESVVQSTSDLLSESSFSGKHEETLERMEDAPDADKESVEESTSVLIAESFLPGEHKGTLERMENALDADKESAVESASDLLSESSFSGEHEETLERMEDAPDADKESVEESTSVLIVESSLSAEHEETLERMEDAPEADKETVVESTSDLIAESSLSEEHEETLERMEDAPDADKETALESTSDLIAESSLSAEHEETLERMEDAPEADKESVVQSTSALIAESFLSAEHEETLERMEDAPDADKETTVESTSDLIAESSLSEEHEETLERMEHAPDTDKESAVESTPDLISKNSLSAEHEETLERMEDAPDADKEAAVESTSALIAESFLSAEHEETLERMEDAPDADKETAVESTSDLIAESSLSAEHEETLERMEDAPDADKETAVESTPDLISESFLPGEHQETLEQIEGAPEADKESAKESTSDVLAESSLPGEHEESAERMENAPEDASKIEVHSADQFTKMESLVPNPICRVEDKGLQDNISKTGMKESTPRNSKRRLYSKNIFLNVTLDHTSEDDAIPRSVSDAEYLGISNIFAHKAHKTKGGQVDSPNTETRKNLPKRSCRAKILNLSEKFLAGDSPVPKFVKPKLIDVEQPIRTDQETSDNTAVAIDGESIPKKPRKKTVEAEASSPIISMSVTGNTSKNVDAYLPQDTPVGLRRGRGRKKAPEAEAPALSESLPVTDGESVIQNPSKETASIQPKPTEAKKGRARKKAVEASLPVTDEESVIQNPLKETASIQPKPTEAKKGRARKKAPEAEAPSPIISMSFTGNTSKMVDAYLPQDTPVGLRRGRGRKKVPEAEAPALSESLPVTDGESVIQNPSKETASIQPKPTEAKKGRARKKVVEAEASSPIISMSVTGNTSKNVDAYLPQDTPVGLRRGRGRKKAPETEAPALSESLPVTDEESVIRNPSKETASIQPKPTEAKKGRARKKAVEAEASSPIISMSFTGNTSKNVDAYLPQDTPVGVRRGRGRKKAPEAEAPALSESLPVTDEESVIQNPLKETASIQPKPTEAKKGRARKKAPEAEAPSPIISMSVTGNTSKIVDAYLPQDTPVGLRRGRGRKKAPEAEAPALSESLPVTDEESVIQNPSKETASIKPKPTEAKKGRARKKAPDAEASEQTQDTQEGVRRGRLRNKAPETEASVLKPSGAVSVNGGESAIAENIYLDERERVATDGNVTEKGTAVAVRRGLRRKVNVQTDEENQENVDNIEIPRESKRSRRVVQLRKND